MASDDWWDKNIDKGGAWDWAKKKWNSYNKSSTKPEDIEDAAQRKRAGGFADQTQQRFNSLGTEATNERDYMRRVARGDESVSRMQLAQALQQNQAQQQSMAAGARPGNAAMAARTASQTAGRQGAGLAGQQAIAGIQERHAAQNALSEMLMRQRQQELEGTLGGRRLAISSRDSGPTGVEKGLGLAQAGASLYSLFSDETLKENVEDGDKDADKVLRALKSVKYDYKDEKYGKGSQLGIMAQGLERAGLGHAVFEADNGKKAVHGAKLAAGLAAMMPGINKRLEELEGKGKKK